MDSSRNVIAKEEVETEPVGAARARLKNMARVRKTFAGAVRFADEATDGGGVTVPDVAAARNSLSLPLPLGRRVRSSVGAGMAVYPTLLLFIPEYQRHWETNTISTRT